MYYDWGLACLDIKIDLCVTTLGALTAVGDLGNRIYERILANMLLIPGLQALDRALGASMRELSIFEGGRSSKSRAPSTRLLDNYCVGIIGESETVPGTSDQRELERVVSIITGSDPTSRDSVACESVRWAAAGFGAQFVIQDALHSSYSYDRERICWMWRLASLYWAALWESSRQLSQRTTQMVSRDAQRTESEETWTRRLAHIAGLDDSSTRDLMEVDRSILATEAFVHELSPRALCAYPLDERVYHGVWSAWKGDELLQDVRSQLALHKDFFSGRIAVRTSKAQERVNLILFVLNVLTFSTVIAALIEVYDVKDAGIEPEVRLALVLSATAGFFTLSFLFLLRRRSAGEQT